MATLGGIVIDGFKSISHAAVDLRPLNVLIGANGSGKSNFIDAVSFLRAVGRGRLHEHVGRAGGADRILHFGSRVTPGLEMQVTLDGGSAGYGFSLRRNDADGLYFVAGGHHPAAEQAEPMRGGDTLGLSASS